MIIVFTFFKYVYEIYSYNHIQLPVYTWTDGIETIGFPFGKSKMSHDKRDLAGCEIGMCRGILPRNVDSKMNWIYHGRLLLIPPVY